MLLRNFCRGTYNPFIFGGDKMKKIGVLFAVKVSVLISLLALGVASQGLAEENMKTKELIQLSLDELLDTTVVTATRTETPLSKVAKSISVVSQEDMKMSKEAFLPELVDNVPGVFLKRNGGPGRLASISIRGTESRFTQFQYNGMPLRDAADAQYTLRAFIQDFYNGGNVERVEVLRGTNSTLYGSQAMGGVVNIITEKWRDDLCLEFRNEMGTRQTALKSARVAYGTEDYYIDINPMHMDTDGEKNGGEHGYLYENLGISGGAGVKLGKDISLEFSTLFFDNDAALNLNTPSLDANHNLVENQAAGDQHYKNQLYQLGLFLNHELSSIWNYTLRGAVSESERHYFWSETPRDQSNYDGKTRYVEMQHNVSPADWLTLTIGADYEKSDYHSQEPLNKYGGVYDPVSYDYDWDVWDAFCNLHFAFLDESLLFDAGGRYNDHKAFDSKMLWEASAAYIFSKIGTKIHAHVGTGYRTPSLYEVYGGYLLNGQLITIGSQNLEPEESTSYEIGVDQFLMKNRLNVGLTYFRTDFDSLIIYDIMGSCYANGTKAKTEGFEGYVHFKPCKYFKLGAAYTYANPEEKSNLTGEWTRKSHFPKNKLNLTASFYPLENLSAYCRVSWVDEKIVPLYDANFSQVQWKEDSVVTVDMAVSYKVSKHFEVWARAENLLDEDYTEGGFSMPGRWVYGGFRLSF